MLEDDFGEDLNNQEKYDITIISTKGVMFDHLKVLLDRIDLNISTCNVVDEILCFENIVEIASNYLTLLKNGANMPVEVLQEGLNELFKSNSLYTFNDMVNDLKKLAPIVSDDNDNDFE